MALKVEEIVAAAFDAYQTDPESVRVLISEVLRSPVFREVEQSASSGIRLISGVLLREVARGELRSNDPFVSACSLFEAIEMAFTTLVMKTPGARPPVVVP